METKAKLLAVDTADGMTYFSFCADGEAPASELEKLQGQELKVKAVRFRKERTRSLSANGLFWHCINKIAEKVDEPPDQVYLSMLTLYGKSTYICCKAGSVERVRRQWKESMVLPDDVTINGQPAKQLWVFYGLSTYDTVEMSKLIDGTIEYMKENGIEPPMPEHVKQALEQWEQNGGDVNV